MGYAEQEAAGPRMLAEIERLKSERDAALSKVSEVSEELGRMRAEFDILKLTNAGLRGENAMMGKMRVIIHRLTKALERIVCFNPSYEYTFENARSIAKQALLGAETQAPAKESPKCNHDWHSIGISLFRCRWCKEESYVHGG